MKLPRHANWTFVSACRLTGLSATLLLISYQAPGSEELPTIDPSVFEIRSAGWWEESGHGGTYRVVIRHGGFEHVNTGVQLEWIMESDASQKARVVHSVRLVDELLGAVEIESMERRDAGVKLVLAGPMHYGPDYHCVIVLRPGGDYKRVSGC